MSVFETLKLIDIAPYSRFYLHTPMEFIECF